MASSDTVNRLLSTARAIQQEVEALGMQPKTSTQSSMFAKIVRDLGLYSATWKLFSDGHYTRAVEEGYKYLQHVVRERSKLSTDGSDLMRTAFSANSPILALSSLATQSEKDEQRGYMDILAGCVTAIRNPRAHSVNAYDDEASALEMLGMANHLVGIARRAKLRRKRKK